MLGVAPIANRSGGVSVVADKMKVLSPALLGAGLLLAQSKTNAISLEFIEAVGVIPNTKLCVLPAGISTGVFGVPMGRLLELVV